MVDVNSINSYFTSLISDIMTVERQPLATLKSSRDTISVQKDLYTQSQTKIEGLKTAVNSLVTSSGSYAIKLNRATEVTPGVTGKTVLTASASTNATLGTYSVQVNQLAQAHQRRSDAATSSSTSLGKSGTITLSGAGANGVDVSFEVTGTDSLTSIADKINSSSSFASGKKVNAAVVGSGSTHYLVLTSAETGAASTMSITDTSGLGLDNSANDVQTAQDAKFKVNNLPPGTDQYFTSAKNTSISGIIQGVTFNLASDAVGQTAQITVNPDVSGAKSTIQKFLDTFNEVQTYLNEQTAMTQNSDGKYSRGALTGDLVFTELRSTMFSNFMSEASPGTYRTLRDIGITLDDNLSASISDSDKLETALLADPNGVAAMLDEVIGKIGQTVDRFTGSSGYIPSALNSFEVQLTDMDTDIENFEERLTDRETSLTEQYTALQAQLLQMYYSQQTWQSIYNGSTSTSS